MSHLSEEELVLLYYGEPGVPEENRDHLAACPACRVSADALARTLNLCNEWVVPEPEGEFERSVWAQLAPHLEERTRLEERKGLRALLRPRWAGAAAVAMAMAALLIAAFVLGRTSRQPEPSMSAGLSQEARERILAISLTDHLDRAEILLTEISNASYTDVADFTSERNRAQDLVEEGRLLRQTLAAQGETATMSLMDEVERFMLEVANAPDQVRPEEVRQLQRRIASGSLLFKVRIIESNLRTQGQKS